MNILTDTKTQKVIFFVSLFFLAFYIFIYAIIIDIYKYPVIGALYESLAPLALISLLMIPLFSVIILAKNKIRSGVYAILSIILTGCSIGVIVFFSK